MPTSAALIQLLLAALSLGSLACVRAILRAPNPGYDWTTALPEIAPLTDGRLVAYDVSPTHDTRGLV